EPAGRGPALIRRLTSGERRSEDHRRQHQHSPDFTQRFHNNLLRERYGGLATLMLPIRPTVIVDGWEAGAAGWAGWGGWAGGAEGQDGQEGAGRLRAEGATASLAVARGGSERARAGWAGWAGWAGRAGTAGRAEEVQDRG